MSSRDALMLDMARRDYAYSDIFRHPMPPGVTVNRFGGPEGDVPGEVANVWKNESNVTVFLSDGTWLTTWGQGHYEGHPIQQIVCATSTDMGKTWSPPAMVQQSCPERNENVAYGAPFVVPGSNRIYVFFFVTANTQGSYWAKHGALEGSQRQYPLHGTGQLYFVYSGDGGQTWSDRLRVDLPARDIDPFADRKQAWINHGPQLMPGNQVMFPFSANPTCMRNVRHFQLAPAECYVLHCENLLEENDPAKLTFKLYPDAPQGIRVDQYANFHNPHLKRLCDFFKGTPMDTGWNFQELTITPLDDGRWLGVGRTCLGAPGFTTSRDEGRTWAPVQPLCFEPGGAPIPHPMTMCPVTRTSDGRIVLLVTNNDGSQRGAKHVWDGNGTTRNPQYIVVGRQKPGVTENAGLIFGEPRLLAQVDESGPLTLKTGISMPQFFEREGRCFVAYNINKEHILLDEIPAAVLDSWTPEV